jgi:hypothetical protein
LDRQKNTGHASDKAIANKRFLRQLGYAVDEIRVNLAKSDQGPFLLAVASAKFLQECRSVAFDCAARILFSKSQVESVSPVNTGKPANSRAESMNQPRNASQVFRTKNGQSSFVGILDRHPNILTIKPG